MRSTYRVLAYLVAAEVVVQAAMIAYALFGLGKWIEGGGILNKTVMEDESSSFTGVTGFMIHGINGQMVIPLLALVLLVVSFFAKVPGAPKWAAAILALVVVQVLLGTLGHGAPLLGALHGVNALILFSVAVMAAHRVGSAQTSGVSATQQVAV